MEKVFPRADLARRIIAGILDHLICMVPYLFVIFGLPLWLLNLLFSALFLTKDAIIFEISRQDEYKNKSIGKKLLNLKIACLDGGHVDWVRSIRRNITLAAGFIVGILPIIGKFFGPLIAFGFIIVEIFLVLTDESGRRIGDRVALTQVVDVEAVVEDKMV